MAKSILRDVAEVAGVSLRTASRVLNEDPRVAIATRARVQQAMRDLKFTPDAMARSLRSGTDTAVGMVVESVADPFFSAMVAAVEQAESTSGKSVLVASTHGDAARERDVVAHMLTRRVSGMLLAPTAEDHAWLDTRTPLVLVDRAAPGLDTDVVGIDDEAAAADAVHHLVAHGHRRIAYISDHPLVPTSRARLAGYRRAMAANGLDTDPRLIRTDCPDGVSAAAATRDLLGRHDSDAPTAVLSADTSLLTRRRADPARDGPDRRRVGQLRRLRDGRLAATRRHRRRSLGRGRRCGGRRPAGRADRQSELPASTIHVPVRLIPRGSGSSGRDRPRGLWSASTWAPRCRRRCSRQPANRWHCQGPHTVDDHAGRRHGGQRRGFRRARYRSAAPRLRACRGRCAAADLRGGRRGAGGKRRAARRRRQPANSRHCLVHRRGIQQINSISLRNNGFGIEFARRTGLPLDCQASVAKMLWFVSGGLELTPAHRWLSVPEYIVFRLGGELVYEPSLASRTGLLDQATGAPGPTERSNSACRPRCCLLGNRTARVPGRCGTPGCPRGYRVPRSSSAGMTIRSQPSESVPPVRTNYSTPLELPT